MRRATPITVMLRAIRSPFSCLSLKECFITRLSSSASLLYLSTSAVAVFHFATKTRTAMRLSSASTVARKSATLLQTFYSVRLPQADACLLHSIRVMTTYPSSVITAWKTEPISSSRVSHFTSSATVLPTDKLKKIG